jgi:long-chain acyl-CoA synthetase
MNTPNPKSTVAHLFELAKLRPEESALAFKQDGAWQNISWQQYALDVRRVAASLVNLGVGKGDVVCILGFNSYEWVLLDLGCIMIGAIPAGIYETSSSEEVSYILNHAEASILLLDTLEQWEKVKNCRDNLTHLRHFITMKNSETIDDPMAMSWEAFIGLGSNSDVDRSEEMHQSTQSSDPATFIYTSGTTGPPKAVMLSNENLVWTASQAIEMLGFSKHDSSISYLPLPHIAEQMFTIHAPIMAGWQVFFATSRLALLDHLKEVKPTILFGVPLIWGRFYEGIRDKLDSASGIKAAIIDFSLKAGRAHHLAVSSGQAGGGWRMALAKKLVFSKVKETLGLTNLKLGVTAAAPISPEILRFLGSLDIPLIECYGQSEGTGIASTNAPWNNRIGTTGPPFPGVEVKVAEDEEIMVKGPNVFLGYYKDGEATESCLKDDWLLSGDVGRFDDEGFLMITGRKKEILMTLGGKNIAPLAVEELLKQIPGVSNAVMIADQRKYCTAIMTLDPAYLLSEKLNVNIDGADRTALVPLLESHGKKMEDFAADPDFIDEIQAEVDEVNSHVGQFQNIQKFTLLPREFTIDEGELTPTLKIKRDKVYQKWAAEIEEMYAD